MTPLTFVAICVAFALAALALARQVQAQQASERDGLAAGDVRAWLASVEQFADEEAA